jgi:membrane associated rhomboid family serine protease
MGAVMFLPFAVDVPMARVPIANWVLIGVTCFVSGAVLCGWRPTADASNTDDDLDRIVQRAVNEAEAPPPFVLRGDEYWCWRLFSHVLVHANWLHLLGNMFFLFIFGNAVNAKLGHIPYVALYFLLGAIGGIAWFLFGRGEYALGASGAIMGIEGLFLVFYPRNTVRALFEFGWAVIPDVEIASVWVILSYVAWDVCGIVFGLGGVAFASHLAGALAGIIVGVGLLLAGAIRTPVYEENLLQVIGGSLGVSPPKPGHPARRERKHDKH